MMIEEFFAKEHRSHGTHPRWDEYEAHAIASYEGSGTPFPMTFAEWLRWS